MWISLSTASGAVNASSPAPSAVIISWSCADSRVNDSTRKALRLPWRLSSQVACQKPSSSSVPPLAPVPGGNGTRSVRGRGRPGRGQVPQHQVQGAARQVSPYHRAAGSSTPKAARAGTRPAASTTRRGARSAPGTASRPGVRWPPAGWARAGSAAVGARE